MQEHPTDDAGKVRRVGPIPVDDGTRPAGSAPPPTPEPGPRPADGKLTRAHMEAAIRSGGSVMHEGRVIERPEDLPQDADLVKGDEAKRAAVVESLDAQIASLSAQRAKLVGDGKPAEKSPATGIPADIEVAVPSPDVPSAPHGDHGGRFEKRK